VIRQLAKLEDTFKMRGFDEMQRLLKREMAYFGRIVTDSPLGIGVFDQQGHWLHFNLALLNLLGFTKAELSQTNFFDHLYEKTSFSYDLQSIHSSAPGESTKQLTTPFINKSGDLIWASTTCSLLTATNDDNLVYSVQIMDLTSQRSTEERLLSTNRLTSAGQLAAGMAHEVRNPLTAIKGFVQLLKRENDKQDYLAVIESEINRMENMLSEFLLLGKPRQNKTSQIYFEDLINHVVTLLHSQALNNHIDLDIKIEKDLPCIVGDETKLKQVFINLLKNAIEAMEIAGCIYLTVKKEDHEIVITIKDQGPGIPEEKLKQLGSPFYSTKEKGTGLGLMMCSLIIREHKGNFRISSSSSGTTVKVNLPIPANNDPNLINK
jgi:two-component system, sporulation sensor kinase A